MELKNLVRKNIFNMAPYSCARNEFSGEASVYLDANENPMNGPYNRYPDPLQLALKKKIAKIKGVRETQIMLGNGSDEPIDLVFRIFCEPRVDNVVAIDPTYGMYQVCAEVNDIEYRKVRLNPDFSMDASRVLAAVDANTKVIWLCSPNNPSGNLLDRSQMRRFLDGFAGIVVIDEAYVDFSSEPSWLSDLGKYPNLIVLQTFSKAWGLASVRCGMAFASEEIIAYYNKVKYPYNVNLLTQTFVNEHLDKETEKAEWVAQILKSRADMKQQLLGLAVVEKVCDSEANFLLVKVKDANAVYRELIARGIVVRNRHNVTLCNDCVRITVGTPAENERLIEEMSKMK